MLYIRREKSMKIKELEVGKVYTIPLVVIPDTFRRVWVAVIFVLDSYANRLY